MDIFGLAAFIYICESLKGSDSSIITYNNDNHIVCREFELFLGWVILIAGVLIACAVIYLCIWSNFMIVYDDGLLFFFYLILDAFVIFIGWIMIDTNKLPKEESTDKDIIK